MDDATPQETGISTEKFIGVMRSIEKSLIGQNRILSDINRTLKASRDAAQEQDESKRRSETIDRVKGKNDNGEDQSGSRSLLEMLKGKFGGIGDNVKSNLNLENALLLFASPFIIEFMSGFFSGIIEKIQDGSLGSAITGNLDWSTIAIAGGFLIGGKKFLLTYAVLSAVMGSLTNWFEDKTGLDVPDFATDPTTIAALSLLIPSLMGWVIRSVAKRLIVAPALAIGRSLWGKVTGAATEATERATTVKPDTELAKNEAAKRAAAEAAERDAIAAAEKAAAEAAERSAADAAKKRAIASTVTSAEKAFAEASAKRLAEEAAARNAAIAAARAAQRGNVIPFPNATERAAGAVERSMASGVTKPSLTGTVAEGIASTTGATAKGVIGRRLIGAALGTPGLALQLALEPSEIALDPQEAVSAWIDRQFQTRGVSAISDVQSFLRSDTGKTLREQFGGVYTEFNDLLDSDFADAYARKLFNAPGNTNKPSSSGLFYGDSNRTINAMMKKFTTGSDGFALSPGALQTKVDTLKGSAASSAGSASSTNVVTGNGNVNRGGDVINNNTTNIFGNPASKSLDEGNSVPRLQYGVQ